MVAWRFNRVVAVLLMLTLSACATAPENINNICAVFDQRDGWFNDWQSGADARRAQIRRAGAGPDGDAAQGIGLPEQRQAAAHQAAGFHPMEASLYRLWLFAGARRHLGAISARDRQQRRAPHLLHRCGRFRRLVPCQVVRNAGHRQERHLQSLSRLLSRLEWLQAWRLAKQTRQSANMPVPPTRWRETMRRRCASAGSSSDPPKTTIGRF